MIELKDFSSRFGARTLLQGVDSLFPDATLTALVGRNGCGKSTLLRAMARLNDRYSGSILIDGEDARRASSVSMARHLAFVNTERTRIPNLKCRDVVAMGRAPYTGWTGSLSPSDEAVVADALRLVGMIDFADRTMDTMSDGECQRVMVARALAQDSPNLLLDEPTSFLDLPNRYQLVDLLRRLSAERGKCIIFSTHELDIALNMTDNIALIADGTIYNLPTSEMRDSSLITEKFELNRYNDFPTTKKDI